MLQAPALGCGRSLLLRCDRHSALARGWLSALQRSHGAASRAVRGAPRPTTPRPTPPVCGVLVFDMEVDDEATMTKAGTPLFSAPEVLRRERHDGAPKTARPLWQGKAHHASPFTFGSWLLHALWRSHAATQRALRG